MRQATISGALANKPANGGNAWSRLSWVRGLQRLGFKVLFIEQIDERSCVDGAGAPAAFELSANLAYFESVMAQFGLTGSSALICDAGRKVHGLSPAELAQRARDSCLLFNFSGHLTLPEVLEAAPCKVYYDDDPGFTQFWHSAGDGGARLQGHDFHYTIGTNIGTPDCCIPTDGIEWRHTLPPVVLPDWPGYAPREFDRFTTVASWRGAYGPVQHAGKTYGLKVHEFRKVFDLPRRSGKAFEIALQIHPNDSKDLDALKAHGWRIVDPQSMAGSCHEFRSYIQASGAEFSVAQGIYVETNSGWFSDRTVRYLASGRPALVQDTGFSRHLPTGEGLVPFRTFEEAVEGADRITRDYPAHCRAARAIAEEFFDSDKVIRLMAGEIGLSLP